MNISDFISKYKNHPVLFIGTGLSLRYLQNSYSWESLLKKIIIDINDNDRLYYDIKSKYYNDGKYDYSKIATDIENIFDDIISKGKTIQDAPNLNDLFYENMHQNKQISRLKLYISILFEKYQIRPEMTEEISEFKKTRKNIGSIITTNYDTFIEDIFGFIPLIGNKILLSNPYGSIYKIHGCCKSPEDIIITDKDYSNFSQKYELIRAQLLSIFIHNPIIFLGYSLGDNNIQNLLSTIFSYITVNSEEAQRVKDNFLVVEYLKDSTNEDVQPYEIVLPNHNHIQINKLQTDAYSKIYSCLSDLQLPISAMDIRKVQDVVKEIYTNGNIKVSITEDINSLKNSDMILAIGSSKTLNYTFANQKTFLNEYFSIIDEENIQLLEGIKKITINSKQYFPCFGFKIICDKKHKSDLIPQKLIDQENEKITSLKSIATERFKSSHTTPADIIHDDTIVVSNKIKSIIYNCLNNIIALDELEQYLRNYDKNSKNTTEYKQLIIIYDYLKYNNA